MDEIQRQQITGFIKETASLVVEWGFDAPSMHKEMLQLHEIIGQLIKARFRTEDAGAKEQLADQAINEMQHLGWLAEELVGGGGNPKIQHTEVDKSTKPSDMLRADIKIEKVVADAYDKAGKETDDPDLKKLLHRIRDNEIYHIDVFNDLLKEEEEK